MKVRRLIINIALLTLVGCSVAPVAPSSQEDMGLLWVKHSAEYQALARQAYLSATEALPQFIGNTAWSAQPGQVNAAHLPPAVILDVDETVVSNVDFQRSFEPPFENWKLHAWTDSTVATPIAGVAEFVAAARAQGVTVFFVTNRPCERIEGVADPCPQKAATIQDIAEVGIETDAQHVMLSEEQGWNREKLTRRQKIAETHRIIMLFGDDLGDFLPCVKSKAHSPCTTVGSKQQRARQVAENRHLWGHGWYVLPNPMHGSWTSFDP